MAKPPSWVRCGRGVVEVVGDAGPAVFAEAAAEGASWADAAGVGEGQAFGGVGAGRISVDAGGAAHRDLGVDVTVRCRVDAVDVHQRGEGELGGHAAVGVPPLAAVPAGWQPKAPGLSRGDA